MIQFCCLSLQFILASKDDFEIHRSDQILFQKVCQKEPLQGKQYLTEENCFWTSSYQRQKFSLINMAWPVSSRPFRRIPLMLFLLSLSQLFSLWFPYNYMFITKMLKAHSIKHIPLIAWIVWPAPWFLHLQGRRQTAPHHPIAYKEIKI